MKYAIDLHCHTVSSGHAYSTLQELATEASNKKLRVLGISDHGPAMAGAPHLFHFHNLRVVPEEMYGVKILKGVEANIIDYDGSLDIPDDCLEQLDYAIASLHPPCIKFGTIEENTNAVIYAMQNPFVKIIGHPDDARFPLDYYKIVEAAKEHNVLLEVNNSSLNVNGYRKGAWENTRTLLNLCKELKVKVILGSDAHISLQVGDFNNCIRAIEEVNFPEELIVNLSQDLSFLQ
jgi:putative hydrolase